MATVYNLCFCKPIFIRDISMALLSFGPSEEMKPVSTGWLVYGV